MQTYFHFTMAKLGAGSIIEPGNWGRLLRRYQHKPSVPNGQFFGVSWILCRELVFEIERLKHTPSKPSRFDAAFVIPTRDQADWYRVANDQFGTQVLHEVEIVDPSAAMHTGDLSYTSWPVQCEFLDPTSEMAKDYWLGNGTGHKEVLTLSALRVVKCLD